MQNDPSILEAFLSLKYELKAEDLLTAVEDPKWASLQKIDMGNLNKILSLVEEKEMLFEIYRKNKKDFVTIYVPRKMDKPLFSYLKGAAIFPAELEYFRDFWEIEKFLDHKPCLEQLAISSFYNHLAAVNYIRQIAITHPKLRRDHDILNVDKLNFDQFYIFVMFTEKTIVPCKTLNVLSKKKEEEIEDSLTLIYNMEITGKYLPL